MIPEPTPCAICGRPIIHGEKFDLLRIGGRNSVVCAAGDISGCRA